ncbi:MAG: transglycosylase SLT domain-containing protein [Nanoarchaeota archaeon]|nr:transglycosylase SLT domain-containing protein [Nanoarchaeota archaeon]
MKKLRNRILLFILGFILGCICAFVLSLYATKDFYIERYSECFSVDERIVRAIIEVESSGCPFAINKDGDTGLMQILPPTAKALGYEGSRLGLFLPANNVFYGTKFLSHLLKNYPLEAAIMQYNLGETKYRKGLRKPSYVIKFKVAFEGLK